MSDTTEETPSIKLGEHVAVEGQPLARVASRLTWPHERQRMIEKEGETTIRTPDGPQKLATALRETQTTYFDSRQTFMSEVRTVIGQGPVATDTADSSSL